MLRKCKYAFLTLAELFADRGRQCARAAAHGEPPGGQEVYEWSSSALDGGRAASSGLKLSPAGALDKLGAVDIFFVCGGINVREAVSPALLTALRRLAEPPRRARGPCAPAAMRSPGGTAGQFSSDHPLGESVGAARGVSARALSDQLFTIDRDRFTCSGGTAPLDLMLNLIQSKLGPRISQLVSEQFMVDRVRKDPDRQYVPLSAHVGVSHRGLIRVAQIMGEPSMPSSTSR